MASNGPLDFKSSVHNAWQQADQRCSGQNHISQSGTDGQSHSWNTQHCKAPAVSFHPHTGAGNECGMGGCASWEQPSFSRAVCQEVAVQVLLLGQTCVRLSAVASQALLFNFSCAPLACGHGGVKM